MKRLVTILLLVLPAWCWGQWSLSGIDTLYWYYGDSVFKIKYTTDPDTLFLNNDTLIMGSAADTCLWFIDGSDIDTWYPVNMDSSFYSTYQGGYFGNRTGISGHDTSMYMITQNLGDGTQGMILNSFQLGFPVLVFSSTKGTDISGISINPHYIIVDSDSLVIDTLPQAAKRFLMTWDSATGQVFALDTTGWGGGGMGGDTCLWRIVNTDTIKTNYNVVVDSSFWMNYGDWKMGYNDPMSYGYNYLYFGDTDGTDENSLKILNYIDEGYLVNKNDRGIVDGDTSSYHLLQSVLGSSWYNMNWVGNSTTSAAYLQLNYDSSEDTASFDLNAIEYNNGNASYITAEPLWMDIKSSGYINIEVIQYIRLSGTVNFQPSDSSSRLPAQEGDVYYDTDDDKLRVYTSAGWVDLN